jgi:hypothetical protein
MVVEENKLNLLQIIPYLLSQSLGANSTVKHKINNDLIAVGKDHQYKILGQTDQNWAKTFSAKDKACQGLTSKLLV